MRPLRLITSSEEKTRSIDKQVFDENTSSDSDGMALKALISWASAFRGVYFHHCSGAAGSTTSKEFQSVLFIGRSGGDGDSSRCCSIWLERACVNSQWMLKMDFPIPGESK